MHMADKKTMIRLQGIVKRYYIGKPNELEILHGIDLDVKEGEFISVVGSSAQCFNFLKFMIFCVMANHNLN